MIKAKLSDSKKYSQANPHFAAAFAFLEEIAKNFKVENIEKGGVRFLCQTYKTAPQCEKKFEAHRKFIDIQFLAEGEEKIYFGSSGEFEVSEPYDEMKDAEFFCGTPREACVLRAGEFAVFFPEDAHQPGCMAGCEPSQVKKVVVKIPV
ncbi:MAG: YhcH/YjgK/YiaL family protein [Opitutales bacterium]|nr:YhcH/YjgK/YiaL family protein [Opitutales bacterium]